MSWTDYTHAKHFGTGIYRPYSDLMGEIVLHFDNLLASDPAFARACKPLQTRDTILVIGESISLVAISQSCYRQYPLFSTFKWNEFWTVSESSFAALNAALLVDANRFDFPALTSHLRDSFSFVDPLVFSISSAFQPAPETPATEHRSKIVSSAAALIFGNERRIYEEAVEMDRPKEIFLSHKSSDKVLVREIAQSLKAIGYSPWLDEDKMKAGANLERAIRDGFSASCAAVFFITPDFIDNNYLATEIDYALMEKRAKGDRFAIIPLQLTGQNGAVGSVPKMIEQFVWKSVEPIHIIKTIVEALPIRMENVVWR